VRRAKPISVVVVAPTRGLVTRLPSLSADLLPTQSIEIQGTLLSAGQIKRAAAVSQNTRYEDGVVCAAPGYQRIVLSSELLQGIVAYWPLQEASSTRFDATPDHYNLTDVPGFFPGLSLDVLSSPGILGGLAALFPPTPPWTSLSDSLGVDGALSEVVTSIYITRQHDLLSSDSALAGGFMNPALGSPPLDLWTLDAALASGAMSLTIITASAPEDSGSLDSAMLSGTYTETVIVADGPGGDSDSMSLDSALESGTYTLVVILADAPSDLISLDGSLASGAYTKTVVGPDSDSDSLSLDAALAGGTYS
jgi:hypothetical protein